MPIQLDHFLGVRSEFVLRILPHFQMHLVPTAIACFFSENNFGVKLHTAAPSLPQHFWLKSAAPLLLRRTKKSGAYYGNNSEDFRREYQRYTKIMESLQQGEYAALLTTDLKLTKVLVSSNILSILFIYANLPIPISAMQFD
jgi:hypothetical protein